MTSLKVGTSNNKTGDRLPNDLPSPNSWLGKIGFVWGFGGFILLLLFAVYRLAPISAQMFDYSLSPLQYIVLIGNSLFMAYSEGYKGFQKAYSPRVVARSWHILKNPTILTVVLAPLFVMAYFDAPKKRVITSWVLTFAIILLIVLFQRLPFPWRSILDAGVVIGLSWGITATLWIAVKKFSGKANDLDPELAIS